MSIQELKTIIQKYLSTDSRRIVQEQKPSNDTRVACVAAIIRWKPNEQISSNSLQSTQQQINNDYQQSEFDLEDFLRQPWIKDGQGQAEMLFIQRAKRPGDFWSGHTAFPGGKDEPSDKTISDTVIRECKEEIGLDLGSTSEFAFIGTVTHKSLHFSRNHDKPFMTLIPFVFLQLTPTTPKLTLQQTEVVETYWISISYLLGNPLVPYSSIINSAEDTEGSSIQGISLLNNNDRPILWGVTLRITQEILGLPITPAPVFSAERIESFKSAAKI